MEPALELSASLSAQLREAIQSHAGAEDSPNEAKLHTLLADPGVRAVTVIIPLSDTGIARVVQVDHNTNSLAQWTQLASI